MYDACAMPLQLLQCTNSGLNENKGKINDLVYKVVHNNVTVTKHNDRVPVDGSHVDCPIHRVTSVVDINIS